MSVRKIGHLDGAPDLCPEDATVLEEREITLDNDDRPKLRLFCSTCLGIYERESDIPLREGAS